jgi:hypothetical protein
MVDIDAIKKRRDWRQGKTLSVTEYRLYNENLATHYAEDVTALIDEVQALRSLLVTVDDWPDGMAMVRQLREALGLFSGAMPISPKEAWDEALDAARNLKLGYCWKCMEQAGGGRDG